MTFLLTIDNNDSFPVSNIQAKYPLSEKLHIEKAGPTVGTYDPGSGLWSIPSLPESETGSLAITAVVVDGRSAVTLTTSAQIIGIGDDSYFYAPATSTLRVETPTVYGALTLHNRVTGVGADESILFPFQVTFEGEGGCAYTAWVPTKRAARRAV